MCWPSKQNMVCIQESFSCSVAVIIGERVVMHILYVKIISSPFIFFFFKKKVLLHNKWHYFIFIQKLYHFPDTQISPQYKRLFVKEFEFWRCLTQLQIKLELQKCKFTAYLT